MIPRIPPCVVGQVPFLGTAGLGWTFLEPVRGAGGSGERINSRSLRAWEAKRLGSEDPAGSLDGGVGCRCLGAGKCWESFLPQVQDGLGRIPSGAPGAKLAPSTNPGP